MSKQRKIHPKLVEREKIDRIVNKVDTWSRLKPLFMPDLPKYHGTQYRGKQKWK